MFVFAFYWCFFTITCYINWHWHCMCVWWHCVCVMCGQGVDLRQYSKNVEAELLEVENASIQDCILCDVLVYWQCWLLFSSSVHEKCQFAYLLSSVQVLSVWAGRRELIFAIFVIHPWWLIISHVAVHGSRVHCLLMFDSFLCIYWDWYRISWSLLNYSEAQTSLIC